MPQWGWYSLLGLGVLLALGWVIYRYREHWQGPWLGPLFRYELIRLTRRGMQPRLRAMYALLLLVGLMVTYLSAFADQDPIQLLFDLNPKIPLARSSEFGSFFAAAYLYTQLIAVVLITPVYAGSAITEEKDRKSMDHLQCSLLSSREIVLGKFAARMTFVAGVILSGMPILALTSFYGGVDEYILFGGFAITLFTQVGLGSYSLYLGTRKESLREVLYWSYGAVLGMICLAIFSIFPVVSALSPFSAIGYLFATGTTSGSPFGMSRTSDLISTIGISAIFNFGLAWLFLWRAIRSIRLEAYEEMTYRGQPIRRAKPKPLPQGKLAIAKPVVTNAMPVVVKYRIPEHKLMDALPPVICDIGDDRPAFAVPARRSYTVAAIQDQDPFLWKERYFTARLPVLEHDLMRTISAVLFVCFVFVLFMILVFGVVNELHTSTGMFKVINRVVRTYVSVTSLGIAVVMGIRTAGNLARERQRDTLLSLLTLPDAKSRILWAKWLSPFLWLRYFIISLLAVLTFGIITGGVYPLGALVGAVYLIGFIPFLNSLGLWLSVTCRTATQAVSAYTLILLAITLGPIFLGVVTDTFTKGSPNETLHQLLTRTAYAFCPPMGVWTPLMTWSEADNTETASSETPAIINYIAVAIAGVFYSGFAFSLYRDARRRFFKEGQT